MRDIVAIAHNQRGANFENPIDRRELELRQNFISRELPHVLYMHEGGDYIAGVIGEEHELFGRLPFELRGADTAWAYYAPKEWNPDTIHKVGSTLVRAAKAEVATAASRLQPYLPKFYLPSSLIPAPVETA